MSRFRFEIPAQSTPLAAAAKDGVSADDPGDNLNDEIYNRARHFSPLSSALR